MHTSETQQIPNSVVHSVASCSRRVRTVQLVTGRPPHVLSLWLLARPATTLLSAAPVCCHCCQRSGWVTVVVGYNTITTVGLAIRYNGQQWSVCLGSSWGRCAVLMYIGLRTCLACVVVVTTHLRCRLSRLCAQRTWLRAPLGTQKKPRSGPTSRQRRAHATAPGAGLHLLLSVAQAL